MNHAKFSPRQNRHCTSTHYSRLAENKEPSKVVLCWPIRPKKSLPSAGFEPATLRSIERCFWLACPMPWSSCWVVGLELNAYGDAILLAGVYSGLPSSSAQFHLNNTGPRLGLQHCTISARSKCRFFESLLKNYCSNFSWFLEICEFSKTRH